MVGDVELYPGDRDADMSPRLTVRSSESGVRCLRLRSVDVIALNARVAASAVADSGDGISTFAVAMAVNPNHLIDSLG
jgi:hypothetical protein